MFPWKRDAKLVVGKSQAQLRNFFDAMAAAVQNAANDRSNDGSLWVPDGDGNVFRCSWPMPCPTFPAETQSVMPFVAAEAVDATVEYCHGVRRGFVKIQLAAPSGHGPIFTLGLDVDQDDHPIPGSARSTMGSDIHGRIPTTEALTRDMLTAMFAKHKGYAKRSLVLTVGKAAKRGIDIQSREPDATPFDMKVGVKEYAFAQRERRLRISLINADTAHLPTQLHAEWDAVFLPDDFNGIGFAGVTKHRITLIQQANGQISTAMRASTAGGESQNTLLAKCLYGDATIRASDLERFWRLATAPLTAEDLAV